MKKLIAKKDFTIDGVSYIENDVVDIKDIAIIRKLNEKGFIYPLSFKELIILERELNSKEEE